LFLVFYSLCGSAMAADAELSEDNLEVSYIYAAVLGTGTYRIKDRRITMIRVPFSRALQKPTEESAGWKLLLPVVAGYDDLSNVDSDWVDALLPDKLVTLTFLPGIEYQYPVTPEWMLKPFVQAGAGRDFKSNETIYMAHLGIRSLSLFDIGDKWVLRWGNTLRWAAEHQVDSGDRLNLSIFETGLDVRRDLPIKFLERSTDMGAYYVFQRLTPRWRSSEAPDYRADATSLHEFGLSVGLKRPRKIIGMDFQRLRVGYKTGGSFRGWTIGTEFPF